MAKKIFTYRGKTVEEMKKMSINEFAEMLPSKERRKVKRGFTEQEKRFLKNLEKRGNNIKTHCRDMVIFPSMIGKTIRVHNGKEYVAVPIGEDMVGHRLGEFSMTRKRIQHSAPGVGATRSSAAQGAGKG